MRRVPVDACGLCPFCFDGAELDDGWRCTAVDLGHEFRRIRRVHDAKRGEWLPPPKWCPLRKEDHLVTLRLKP